LLADFSSLADPAVATTVSVYVHVEPLILSALRDPSLIADGQVQVEREEEEEEEEEEEPSRKVLERCAQPSGKGEGR
jgi:hypothetical protein